MGNRSFRTLHQIVESARSRLDQTSWNYLVGGSDTETTLRRNRLALDSLALEARVLRDVAVIDTRVSLLGHSLDMPCLLAPLGAMETFDPGGAATAAVAAARARIPVFKSSVCEPDLETVAAASDAIKFFQLYVRGDAAWVDDIVRRVVRSGYHGFCLTVDTAVVSRRERDIARNVVPTSPVTHGELEYQARVTWDDVRRMRDVCTIPLIVKGITTVADASTAAGIGVDAIYVSNHGGRQLDHGRATMDVLPEIVDAVGGNVEVIVDGGFCRGTDVVKAMALGARAVGLGRLQAWALAAGGEAALVDCLEILHDEIRTVMALCGVALFAQLDATFVSPARPVSEASVSSAFPLLGPEPPAD
jgi:glycolate oxidase